LVLDAVADRQCGEHDLQVSLDRFPLVVIPDSDRGTLDRTVTDALPGHMLEPVPDRLGSDDTSLTNYALIRYSAVPEALQVFVRVEELERPTRRQLPVARGSLRSR
jgi:hypothetical protein